MKKYSYYIICGLVAMLASCGNSKSKYASYRDAVAVYDFSAAHDILDILHEEYIEEMSEARWLSEYRPKQQQYFEALEYIYLKEIAYLLAENIEDAEDRVVFSIMEIPIDGSVREGILHYDQSRVNREAGFPLNMASEVYSKINTICDKALILSLNRGNLTFALNIVDLYKEDIVETWGWRGGNVELKWTSKNAAKAKVDAAIKDGRLK